MRCFTAAPRGAESLSVPPNIRGRRRSSAVVVVVLMAACWAGLVGGHAAAEVAAPPAYTTDAMVSRLWVAADTVWVLVCGMLVFFMNLGFGCVEAGFARSKNCVNILSKNFIVFAATSVAYFLCGWDLMFGAGDGGFIGTAGSWLVAGADNSPAVGDRYEGVYRSISWASVPLWTKFFFQLVFAGTAATIVSGAVAERIKYHTFVLFSFLMALAIYPVTGHWIWGGGYLAARWTSRTSPAAPRCTRSAAGRPSPAP
jgi:Amt family ammonium transporter